MLSLKGTLDRKGKPEPAGACGVESQLLCRLGANNVKISFHNLAENHVTCFEEALVVLPAWSRQYEMRPAELLTDLLENKEVDKLSVPSTLVLNRVNLGALFQPNVLNILTKEYGATIIWGSSQGGCGATTEGIYMGRTGELKMSLDDETIHSLGTPFATFVSKKHCYEDRAIFTANLLDGNPNMRLTGASIGKGYLQFTKKLMENTYLIDNVSILIDSDIANNTKLELAGKRIAVLVNDECQYEVVPAKLSLQWVPAVCNESTGLDVLYLDIDWEQLAQKIKTGVGEDCVMVRKDVIDFLEGIGLQLDSHEHYDFLASISRKQDILSRKWPLIPGYYCLHVTNGRTPFHANNTQRFCRDVATLIDKRFNAEIDSDLDELQVDQRSFRYTRLSIPQNAISAYISDDKLKIQQSNNTGVRASISQLEHGDWKLITRTACGRDASVGGIKGCGGL